ncbi:hypothetical protein [Streptomyces sp. NBC_00316]|uniref:hypothetical protein n=1 Tax=Streptomyces sp. NBC_00316 TaxID=2975710 RepID=UPI002E2BE205|nr:hypothetical protein [Streptomyces sp. NBC_00316]
MRERHGRRSPATRSAVGLPAGGDASHLVLDIGRLQADTGYRAEYGTERAAGDHIAWLRAGNKI